VTQTSLFDPPETKPLGPTQQEVVEALRWLIVASDTSDIQRALAEHNINRQRNEIAKRLGELEARGLVARTGRNFDRRGWPTTWKRVS
jgi:predicted transcriptional regulator